MCLYCLPLLVISVSMTSNERLSSHKSYGMLPSELMASTSAPLHTAFREHGIVKTFMHSEVKQTQKQVEVRLSVLMQLSECKDPSPIALLIYQVEQSTLLFLSYFTDNIPFKCANDSKNDKLQISFTIHAIHGSHKFPITVHVLLLQ